MLTRRSRATGGLGSHPLHRKSNASNPVLEPASTPCTASIRLICNFALALDLDRVGCVLCADVTNPGTAQPMANELGQIMFADTLNPLGPVPDARHGKFQPSDCPVRYHVW